MAEKREIINATPIRRVLEQITTREINARGLRDERTAELMGDVRKMLDEALADAERLPEQGIDIREYAAREGISIATAYKRGQRGKLQIEKDAAGHVTVLL